ncbi:MAG: beta-lactamase class [Acidimicrobiales bacterium]|nr:beta-lactamase class [Acidimicrobiales bacterium]
MLRPRTVIPSATHDARLAAALWTTARWKAPHVAAAVVGPADAVATVGPAARPFPLASVTKLFLAYACLVAVEEGTLDLDGAAGQPGATVRHLLAHAAGFGFDTGVLTQPGRKRIYSNTGFEALALHLGERAGMDAVDYVTGAVFEPLGLSSTTIGAGGLAHGGTSTVADMTRFAAELLAPTVVDRSTLAEATTVAFPGLDGALPGIGTQRPNDWGLGFELRDHKTPHWTGATNSPETFGHYGGAGTFLWVDPAIGCSLIVLTDHAFGPWALEAWPPLSDAVVAATRRR